MCGNCRAIVAGAFVVGAAIGAVATTILLDRKYKEGYAREVEASRAAAKRVIKSLREKIERRERVDISEELSKEMDEAAELEGQENFDSYLEKLEYIYLEETSKTESEKIPEGKIEVAISTNPDMVDFYYVKEINKWFNDEGDPLTEAEMKDILTEDGLKEAYADAAVTSWTVVRGYTIAFKIPMGFEVV